ncbi:MAG: PDZ domain-containing protein [Actinobacteria bacterium]|nr:PDZ domain-containing protein [Actinomycetota bacterium]
MSDETPSTPETPEAPVPAPPVPAPPVPAPPVAETPVAETPTGPVETPAEPMASGPSEPPVAVAPAAAAPERTGNYVAVPRWLLTAVAVIVGAAVMFGIGYAVGDRVGNDDDRAAVSTPSGNDVPMFPGQGRGNLPMFPGQGQGQGQRNPTTPQTPSQGNQGQGTAPSPSGAFLGVATQPTTGGLEVTQVVTNSAAARAGLQVGDVIVSVDGDAVTTPAQLAAAVASQRPGDDVRIAYTRSGANRTVTVELGTRPTTGN